MRVKTLSLGNSVLGSINAISNLEGLKKVATEEQCPNCGMTLDKSKLTCSVCGFKINLSAALTGIPTTEKSDIFYFDQNDASFGPKEAKANMEHKNRNTEPKLPPSEESKREIEQELRDRKIRRVSTNPNNPANQATDRPIHRPTVPGGLNNDISWIPRHTERNPKKTLSLLLAFILLAILLAKVFVSYSQDHNVNFHKFFNFFLGTVKSFETTVSTESSCKSLKNRLIEMHSQTQEAQANYEEKKLELEKWRKTAVSGRDAKLYMQKDESVSRLMIVPVKKYLKEIQEAKKFDNCWTAATYSSIYFDEFGAQLLIDEITKLLDYTKEASSYLPDSLDNAESQGSSFTEPGIYEKYKEGFILDN